MRQVQHRWKDTVVNKQMRQVDIELLRFDFYVATLCECVVSIANISKFN